MTWKEVKKAKFIRNLRISVRIILSLTIILVSVKLAFSFWEKRNDTILSLKAQVEEFHENEERKAELKTLISEEKKVEAEITKTKEDVAVVQAASEEIQKRIEQDKSGLTVLDKYKEEFAQYQNDFSVLDAYNLTYFEGKYDMAGIEEVAFSNKLSNVVMEIGQYLPGMTLITNIFGNCMQSNNTRYYEYMEQLNEYMCDNMQEPMTELSLAIQKMHAKLEFYHSFVDEENSLTEQYRNARLLESANEQIWKLDEIFEEKEKVAKAAYKMMILAKETREIYKFVLDEDDNWEYFDSLDSMIDDNRELYEQLGNPEQNYLTKSEKMEMLEGYIDIYCDTIDEACRPELGANITGMDLKYENVYPTSFLGTDGFELHKNTNRKQQDALSYMSGETNRGNRFEVYYYMNGQPARAYFNKLGTLYFDVNGHELSGTADDEDVEIIYDHLVWCADNYKTEGFGKTVQSVLSPYTVRPS